MGKPTTRELAAMLGLEVQERVLAPNGTNIPAGTMDGGTFASVTIHETGNTNAGADAIMHWQFVKNGGGEYRVSFTYSVDDKRAVQILKENQINYAQGTSQGNRTSLSIETCVNKNGVWPKTLDNLCKLVAAILVANGKPVTFIKQSIRQHHSWYGKNCPTKIRSEGIWSGLLEWVDRYMGEIYAKLEPSTPTPTPTPQPAVPTRHFPETGFTSQGAILQYWEQNGGLATYGFPVENETLRTLQDGRSYVTQIYQRRMLHWMPGEQVGEGLLGTMYKELEKQLA